MTFLRMYEMDLRKSVDLIIEGRVSAYLDEESPLRRETLLSYHKLWSVKGTWKVEFRPHEKIPFDGDSPLTS